MPFFTFAFISIAQNVDIGAFKPNAIAVLEVKASDKGILVPGTSSASRIREVTWVRIPRQI